MPWTCATARRCAAAQDFIAHCGGRVDVVIASAGVSAGTLTEAGEDYAVFKEIVDTNLLATVATFEPFIAGMRAGRLVGIASVAGVRGLPGAGAYSASRRRSRRIAKACGWSWRRPACGW